jgi:hypothetical protein
MFNHTFQQFNINDNCYVIPFGTRCTSVITCKVANLRKFSLPFDWVFKLYPSKIKEILSNEFVDYIPDVYNGKHFNKYSVGIPYFNYADIPKGIEEYKRRIERFNIILSENKKIYFIKKFVIK